MNLGSNKRVSIQYITTFPTFPLSPEEKALPHAMASNLLRSYYSSNAHTTGPQAFHVVNGGLSWGFK